jgi:hypothetical protein
VACATPPVAPHLARPDRWSTSRSISLVVDGDNDDYSTRIRELLDVAARMAGLRPTQAGQADLDVVVKYRIARTKKTYNVVVNGKVTDETESVADNEAISGTVTASGAMNMRAAFEGEREARLFITLDRDGHQTEHLTSAWGVTNFIDAIAPVLLTFAPPRQAVEVASALAGGTFFKPLDPACYRQVVAEATDGPGVSARDLCSIGEMAAQVPGASGAADRAFSKCVARDAGNLEGWYAKATFHEGLREDVAAQEALAKVDALLRAKGAALPALARKHPQDGLRLRAIPMVDDDAVLGEILCADESLQVAAAAGARLVARKVPLTPEAFDCVLRFGRFSEFRDLLSRQPPASRLRGPHYQRVYPRIVKLVASLASDTNSDSSADGFYDPIDFLKAAQEPRAFGVVVPALGSWLTGVPDRVLRRLRDLPNPGGPENEAPALAALSTLLQSPNESIRWHATAALRMMKTPGSRRLLEQVRERDPERKVREQAEQGLAEGPR